MSSPPFTSSSTDESMDQGAHAVSSASAPVIDLPHRWDKNGELLPGTSPSVCPICEWNGDPGGFWDDDQMGSWELSGKDSMQEPLNCASCKLLRSILFKRAELEGRQVTESKIALGMDFHVATQIDDESDYVDYSVFVSSDTPESDIDHYNIPRRFILNDDNLNHRSSKWAQERLAACASSHELCRSQSSDSFLPARLINLQPGWKGLDVRLEDSSTVPSGSSYVALSYCWGDYRPDCITTADTVAQNQLRIPWDKLPATFQDAAAFTLSLGIQYLWIDSVCIIQGDEEDWRREAGKMYAVYKNSFLTLAALSGSASTSGLRQISIKQDSHLVAEFRTAQDVYPVYIRREHYLAPFSQETHDKKDALAPRYPLLGRAWAYQERIVSPRVMFFTQSEIIFQCLESVWCECGAADMQRSIISTNKTKIVMQTKFASLKLKGRASSFGSSSSGSDQSIYDLRAEDRQDWEIAGSWNDSVVTGYSNLNCSMPRDRLPALGAIAEQFKRVRMGETYLAGLWSRSLLDDLLWVCYAEYAEQPWSKKSKAELERPYSLPTWSWASLQCSVQYYGLGVSAPRAEVLEANCSYVGGNEFGVLQSSKLVLRGRLLESILKWTHRDDGSFSCSFFLCDGGIWTEHVPNDWRDLTINMDMDQDGARRIPPRQEIYILEISESVTHPTDPIYWRFLLLRRDDQDGFVFTRAGAAIFRRLSPQERIRFEDAFESAFEARSVLTTCEIR